MSEKPIVTVVAPAFENAAEFDGPVVVHVLTQKGKGFAPAEQDEIKAMHDAKPGLADNGGAAKTGSYTAAFSETLVKLGDQHPELVAITAAMPDSTGLLPFRDRFPDRCIDVGIAEQHAVTAAAGMAMGGLRPLVAVYSTFLTRAIDQVNLDVGLHLLHCELKGARLIAHRGHHNIGSPKRRGRGGGSERERGRE